MGIQRWQALIDAERAQSDRIRGAAPPSDYWPSFARGFRVDPRRSDDPLVNRLLQEVAPHHTVIDVGAGGGRLALPLALRCRRVAAVEPSASMANVLLQQMADCHIPNVSLVTSPWEEAEVGVADIVLCSHVLYTIRNIEPFVRKLEAHARERVLTVLFQDRPQARIDPLWQDIHGEARQPLPSLSAFQDVLDELGIEAQTGEIPPQPPRGFDSLEEALQQLSRRLYLKPDTPKWARLKQILPERLEEVGGVFQIRGAGLVRIALVRWHPA